MKILVVEDEHRIAGAIKKGLELEKMTVDVAYNGSDGLDLAMGDSYQVIVMDLMLPGMDGMKVVEELRKSHIDTPILMLTARSQIDDKILGFKSGVDDYLTKPFAFEELLARIKALVRRPKQLEEEVLKAGTLQINTTTFEVKNGNNSITLSTKEYQLLLYLMRHKGKIVSKERIMEQVWNYDSDILPNTVEVYIKKLRAKNLAIETVRGFGYRLRETDV